MKYLRFSEPLLFRVRPIDRKKIDKICEKREMPIAELMREYVAAGLEKDGNLSGM